MVAYKESPTVSAVLDFSFDRLVGDKHHTADIQIEVTPTHREGDNESKPRWSISTHNNENEPVTLNLTLNDLKPDFLETGLFEPGF